jgi:hypothetical protein
METDSAHAYNAGAGDSSFFTIRLASEDLESELLAFASGY